MTIPAGGVAVVEIDEAYRVVADAADPRVVVLHVTVEGYSFLTSSIRPFGRLLRAVKGMALLTPFSPFPLAGVSSVIAFAARTVLETFNG